MAPKRRLSTGTTTAPVVAFKDLQSKVGSDVTVEGKLMTKSGVMIGKTNATPWAFATLQDEVDGPRVRIRGFYGKATAISEKPLFSTVRIQGAKVELDKESGRAELFVGLACVVSSASRQLDEQCEWDTTEYGPLTDIGEKPETEKLYTVFKADHVSDEVKDGYFRVEASDVESTSRVLQVHESFRNVVVQQGYFVLHRGSCSGTVAPNACVDVAPESYTW
eukprot:gb/GFBE01072713.1/.p1 GENE.gb/GFBE01072713.1/~~gb/GFBE01072713.1/.p1  ORF type:complete len:221 (+),score=24.88 gb/GFBE01072713.1/:1-663(+)